MFKEVLTQIQNAPKSIVDKPKFKIREHWDAPLEYQSQLVKRHLKLCSYAAGIPHYFSDLAEDIINSWFSILTAVKSPLVRFGHNTFINDLREEAGILSDEEAREENLRLNHFAEHMETIRVFEGFAGYGGASFGLRRSGIPHEVIGMSEFDPFASQLLAQNFPGIHNWGDITQINANELPDFDLFTGGFPCQPFQALGCNWG